MSITSDWIAGIFNSFGGSLGVTPAQQEVIRQQMAAYAEGEDDSLIQQWARKYAGLEVSNPLDEAAWGRAITSKVASRSGIEFTNVFSAEAVKADVKKYVAGTIEQALGVSIPAFTQEGIRGAVKEAVTRELQQGGGTLVTQDAIANFRDAVLAQIQVPNGQGGAIDAKTARKRELQRGYQATYASKHTRRWVKA